MNRGMNSSILIDTEITSVVEVFHRVYQKYYKDERFIRVLYSGKLSDTKNASMTNTCKIGFIYDEHTGKLIVTYAIDNLTKGASGQATNSVYEYNVWY